MSDELNNLLTTAINNVEALAKSYPDKPIGPNLAKSIGALRIVRSLFAAASTFSTARGSRVRDMAIVAADPDDLETIMFLWWSEHLQKQDAAVEDEATNEPDDRMATILRSARYLETSHRRPALMTSIRSRPDQMEHLEAAEIMEKLC